MTFTKTTNKNNNNKEEEKLKEDKPVNFCVVEYYSYTCGLLFFFFLRNKQTHTHKGEGKCGLHVMVCSYIGEKECNYYLIIYCDLLIIINKITKELNYYLNLINVTHFSFMEY